jgi:hypothetical protein
MKTLKEIRNLTRKQIINTLVKVDKEMIQEELFSDNFDFLEQLLRGETKQYNKWTLKELREEMRDCGY